MIHKKRPGAMPSLVVDMLAVSLRSLGKHGTQLFVVLRRSNIA